MGAGEAAPNVGAVLVRPDGGAAPIPPTPIPTPAPNPPAGAAGVDVAPKRGGLAAPPWLPNWKEGGAELKAGTEAAGVGAGESRGLALMSMEPPPGDGTLPSPPPLPLGFRPGVAVVPPPLNEKELRAPGAGAVGAGAAPKVKGGKPPPVPMLLPLLDAGREAGKAGKDGVLFNPPEVVEADVAESKPPTPAGWSATAEVPERGGRVDGTSANRLPLVEPALLGLDGARDTGGKTNGPEAGTRSEEEEEEAVENRLDETGAAWAAGAPNVPKEGAVKVVAPPAVPVPPKVKEGVEGAGVVLVVLAVSLSPPLAELSAAAVDEEGNPPKVKEGNRGAGAAASFSLSAATLLVLVPKTNGEIADAGAA